MRGFPKELRTKQDYLNAAEYVKSNGEGKSLLIARLKELKMTTTMMILKESSRSMRAEKQHQEDYIPAPDPNCEMLRLGFTGKEIDDLIGGLK
ncbi:MAG: hypothetical protein ABFD11_01025 [Christensenella sp.]